MSAQLGDILKRHRLQKALKREDISLRLEWKDSTKLSRIEQGILEKPSREDIEKICDVLEIPEQEKNQLLLVGNYLPTREEITRIQAEQQDYIEQWPYPAVVYDFCWRAILVNTKAMKILGMSENDRKLIYETSPSALEIIFDPQYVQNTHLKGEELEIWHRNLYRFVVHFKNLQHSIVKDPWYASMMKRMMDNELFCTIWKKVQQEEISFPTTRSGKKIFVPPNDTEKRLHFNIFVVPLLKDPRFELEFFNPGNTDTADYFSQPAL